MGKFKRDEVATLLVRCHRRCCICHRFCGVKIETDHIVPSDEGGTDQIDNAVPVCLECHAEIHCYNAAHPRGRKFTPEELRGHKQQWLSMCENNPQILAETRPTSDVGPLNSLVDELEYNLEACEQRGSLLSVQQFEEALRRGAISFLEPGLKKTINSAYARISHLNELYHAFTHQDFSAHSARELRSNQIKTAEPETKEAIQRAHKELLEFLQKDSGN